jgi:hypothetical protein
MELPGKSSTFYGTLFIRLLRLDSAVLQPEAEVRENNIKRYEKAMH